MATTFDPALICQVCCDQFLLSTCETLAPVSGFYRQCTVNAMAPLQPISVPVIGEGAAIANPPSFETSTAGVTQILVTPKYLSAPFQISAIQAQQGFSLTSLADAHAQALAKAMWAEILPHISSAAGKFDDNPPITDAAADFGPESLKKVYAALKCTPKHLILDTSLYASVMFSTNGGCCFPLTSGSGPGAYGFASIHEHNVWAVPPAAADAGTLGFAYCPSAIVVASGLPVTAPQCEGVITRQVVTVPGIGISVAFHLWCSTATRTLWGSYDVIFGAAMGVPCAGVLIKPTLALAAGTQAASGKAK